MYLCVCVLQQNVGLAAGDETDEIESTAHIGIKEEVFQHGALHICSIIDAMSSGENQSLNTCYIILSTALSISFK